MLPQRSVAVIFEYIKLLIMMIMTVVLLVVVVVVVVMESVEH